jgi:thiol-disulfide isomerase/thioredoxin
MKTINIIAAALLMAMSANAQNFTVTGKIRGLVNGAEVGIVSIVDGNQVDVAKTKVVNGAFKLIGHVSHPTLVTLKINDKAKYKPGEYAEDRGTQLMLENVPTTISAVCLDSIPKNYEYQSTPLFMEKNVKVKGGKAEEQYLEWRNVMHDAELQGWKADLALRKYSFEKREKDKDVSEEGRLKQDFVTKDSVRKALNDKFINEHPSYAISLKLQQDKLEDIFHYTNADYDAMLAKFKDNYDQAGYAEFAKTVEYMRKYVKGSPYTDFAITATDGTAKKFSDCIVAGKYNFIDFWASWCGPCRMAIPEVKKMHEEVGDKLNIVSVSVDAKSDDWKRAMDEEKMPWSQYLVPKESMKILHEAYMINAIPDLLIIDPEGKVVLATHEPDEAHAFIKGLK